MVKKIQCKDNIASWKIDSPRERRLAKRADSSEYWKARYVDYYRRNDSEYYEKGLKMLRHALEVHLGSENTEQNFEKYYRDMIYSLHRFGATFDEYFIYGFERLNTEGRESFVTDKNRWALYDQLNLRENLELFNNKKKAYEHFKAYYGREMILIEDGKDLPLFREFTVWHPRFIAKPFNGSGGVGVAIHDLTDYADASLLFAELTEKGPVVCEELIVQDERMASFHPLSVNSMRVPTIRVGDEVILFYPYLRIGCGDEITDNCAKDRIVAPVDAKTGLMWGTGMDKEHHVRLVHPDTGVVIPGFQIPRWDELVELVTKLAKEVPGNHYVGWDIALSVNGWVMIEGNPRGELAAVQYTTGKGVKKELDELIRRIRETE